MSAFQPVENTRCRDPRFVLFPWLAASDYRLSDCRYELPIKIPVIKTSAPPKPTCSAAEGIGVSI